ncbi:MAG TPA: DUF4365 domain-containing protein [Flavobacterium sp.]|nr:DUF4365 domain-containing protein [Flavobacterium sp.]
MTNNAIGDLGEAIFNVEISRDYLFRPRHLGEKWPSSDFYVELVGLKQNFFFIVQVKSTTQGYDASGFLKVKAPRQKLHALNAYYCPTYVAGVNVDTGEVYLIPINTNKRKDLSKMPVTFALNKANRKKLFDDVKRFWENSGLDVYKRNFKHKL